MKFYSASTKGFYTPEINGDNMPEDVVEISDEQHEELLTAQSNGKAIEPDASGYPEAVDLPALTTEQQSASVLAERGRRLAASDWTQLGDVPQEISLAWRQYRQTLRDLPTQPGFPASITWPNPPA